MPEVDGREGCWVGRAVEEVDGSVIRQGAVGAGRGIFFRVDSVLVGFEFGAVVAVVPQVKQLLNHKPPLPIQQLLAKGKPE